MAHAGHYVFFDCDDCLYMNNWQTGNKITKSISNYTETLGISEERSYDLYKTHGTCLKGMLAEGIIEQQRVEDYLEKVHDIDYSDIAADASLRDMLGKCVTKDRRHVFTASTKEHASRCIAKVLSPSTVDDYFTAMVDTRVCKLETKHSPSSFVAAMDAAGVPEEVRKTRASACVLLDDSVTNIKCAKAMGWTTVLVGKIERDTGGELATPVEADYHIASLHQLPSAMPELFTN